MNQQRENLNMSKWRVRTAAFVLGLAAPLIGWAQNTIQSITSSQQAGSEVVRIELSEALGAVPAGFTVQAPPRVAIDLPGIGNGLGRSTVDINQGNLRSVSVAQAGDRTRLVFNLKQAANYKAELQGKVLIVVLEGSGAAAAAGPTGEPVHFAASQNREQLPLKDVDFRRGPDGAGRVIVGLANTQVGVDIRQQGQSLVVEFLRSTLPDALRRRLDVTDFGTPVQTVSASQNGDRVRLVVEPRGTWEHR
jgi:type IV pilus assembly protein PilQ